MHFPGPKVTRNAYILTVLELVRKDARFFLAATLAGLALRLVLVLHFPAVVDDSRLYADIAENWLQHGVYGITNSGEVVPTLSRLPGYPAFLAAVFAIFGWSNFRAVLLIQVLFDLGTCFLVADLARRMISDRAVKFAFALAALCPFLANYSAAALTETLEIFFTALALDLAVYGVETLRENSSSMQRSAMWLGCGLSTGACILLRPDGGILFAAIGAYLFLLLFRRELEPRNTPRYANDSDEFVMAGFNRWTKTWIADYTSVQEIYWKVPGDSIDVARLPDRAFDSVAQRLETEQLFADYNQDHEITPELDARFATLAEARVKGAPLRYYLWLPALRVAAVWLRPRTELLPSDPRWWEFDDDPLWLTVSIVFGLVNLGYVAMAAAGLLRAGAFRCVGLFVLFLLLRSLLLATLENPEPRYTLECYPVIIVAAAAFCINKTHHYKQKTA